MRVGYGGSGPARPSRSGGVGGGGGLRSPGSDIKTLEIIKIQLHNQEATNMCRLVRLTSVCFEHCILWLVLSIRCSVIVLIGLLLREFLCLF